MAIAFFISHCMYSRGKLQLHWFFHSRMNILNSIAITVVVVELAYNAMALLLRAPPSR